MQTRILELKFQEQIEFHVVGHYIQLLGTTHPARAIMNVKLRNQDFVVRAAELPLPVDIEAREEFLKIGNAFQWNAGESNERDQR